MSQGLNFEEDTELQVGMYEAERPFISLVGNEGTWGLGDIGMVTRDRVELGDATDLHSYTFRSNQVNDGNVFQIGAVKADGFNDHRPLYEPLLDNGWVVKQHHVARGGLQVLTIFDYPEIQFEDPITWDARLFEGMSRDNSYLTPSIMVKANTRQGSMAHVTGGFMRLICLNGLVAKALDLGDAKFSIWKSDPDQIANSVYSIAEDVRTMRPFNEQAARQFPVRSARWLATALRDLDDENKPKMIAESLGSLTKHLHEGERANLALNFALMATQHTEPEVSVLDTLNAITNASEMKASSSLDMALTAADHLLELGEYITR